MKFFLVFGQQSQQKTTNICKAKAEKVTDTWEGETRKNMKWH